MKLRYACSAQSQAITRTYKELISKNNIILELKALLDERNIEEVKSRLQPFDTRTELLVL